MVIWKDKDSNAVTEQVERRVRRAARIRAGLGVEGQGQTGALSRGRARPGATPT